MDGKEYLCEAIGNKAQELINQWVDTISDYCNNGAELYWGGDMRDVSLDPEIEKLGCKIEKCENEGQTYCIIPTNIKIWFLEDDQTAIMILENGKLMFAKMNDDSFCIIHELPNKVIETFIREVANYLFLT